MSSAVMNQIQNAHNRIRVLQQNVSQAVIDNRFISPGTSRKIKLACWAAAVLILLVAVFLVGSSPVVAGALVVFGAGAGYAGVRIESVAIIKNKIRMANEAIYIEVLAHKAQWKKKYDETRFGGTRDAEYSSSQNPDLVQYQNQVPGLTDESVRDASRAMQSQNGESLELDLHDTEIEFKKTNL